MDIWISVILIIFLGIYTVSDIRSGEVWWPLAAATGITGLIMRAVVPELSLWQGLAGLVPGAALLILSKTAGSAVGEGDCAALAACGSFTGFSYACELILVSLLMAACWAVLLMVKRGGRAFKQTFPFMPFMLAAQICLGIVEQRRLL